MMRKCDELLNVDYITRNMRENGTGQKAVLATKHPPYAISLAPNAKRIHKVRGVRIDFRSRTRATVLVVFECGDTTWTPQFFDDIPEIPCKVICPLCAKHIGLDIEPPVRQMVTVQVRKRPWWRRWSAA